MKENKKIYFSANPPKQNKYINIIYFDDKYNDENYLTFVNIEIYDFQ